MKKILLIMLLAATTSPLFSQPETLPADDAKNEIGFNVTMMLGHIFGWNNAYVYDYYPYGYYNYYPNQDYWLTYKRYFSNSALRFGAGGNMNSSKSDNDTDTYSTESSYSNFNVRLGYEFEWRFAEKFNFYYGADLLMRSSSNEYSVFYDSPATGYTSSNKSFTVGGGPLAGISWFVSKRLKLSTEASLNFLSTSAENKVEYELTPELNSDVQTTGMQIDACYPVFLYLELKF